MKWSEEEYRDRRYRLKRLVKTYYDIQHMNILISNRVGWKSDRTEMNRETVISGDEWALYETILDNFSNVMDGNGQNGDRSLKTKIEEELSEWLIYTEWLKGVKGIAWHMGAIICSEIDIIEATVVSKMWQYSGLNPGMVRGMKAMAVKNAKTYKPKEGDVIRRTKGCVIVRTFDMVRGDRLTPGYLAPFNQSLRAKLIGVLAPGFLKAHSPYTQHYYRLHVPLSRREEMGFGRLDLEEGWKDKSEGHRSNYARRVMIKEFEKDLYDAWRTLEKLPKRPSYAEEYLGKVHHEDVA